MGSKSLTPEQNEHARELVHALIRDRYQGKKVLAAKAFGVSQPLLSGFLGRNKGLGAKLIAGISRRAPDVAAKILGHAKVEDNEPAQVVDAPTDARPAISVETVEAAVSVLTDEGYPYKSVRAALIGIGAYESARERRERKINAEEAATLAAGLLDRDATVTRRESPARATNLKRAHERALGDAQKFSKRADGVGKGRAAK